LLIALPLVVAAAGSATAQVVTPAAQFEAQLPPLVPLEPATFMPTPPPPTIDPALVRPLVPLATFAVDPGATMTATDKAAEVRYRVTTAGLKEVDLDARFRTLSALLEKGRTAGSAAQVSARAVEDQALAERLLHAEGYYDAKVDTVVGPLPDAAGELLVALTATPGARYTLATVAVTGAAPEPTRLAVAALDLHPGAPLVAPAIETAEAEVALRLPEAGYPFVKVGDRTVLLNDTTPVADYTLPLDAGAKARFGGFRTAGDAVLAPAHIAVLPRFKPGEIYDSRRVDDLRQALIATSLFSAVGVEPVPTGRFAADGTETVDLLVQETKGPWRQLAGSAGYSTGEGAKISGSWTNRNRFPPEGALTFAVVAGTQEQSLNALFRRSNAGQRDRSFQINASAARQRFAAYAAETLELGATLARTSTPIWQKRWTWSAGTELIATRETRFTAAALNRRNGTFVIAAVPLQLGYDRSDSLLDPTKGFRLTGRLSPEAQQTAAGGGGFDGYARLLAEATGYVQVSSSVVVAARTRVGSIVGAPRDAIAPSRRLYAGGGGSVRGFGYQELGPRDANNDPLGGRSLTEFAVEARYRFGHYGIVPFVDAGRVGVDPMPSLSGLRYGVGIGGRYYTNFGPLRIDIATPIDRRRGEGRVAVYFSIGQAF
jgi:translocation and assembly module TamA